MYEHVHPVFLPPLTLLVWLHTSVVIDVTYIINVYDYDGDEKINTVVLLIKTISISDSKVLALLKYELHTDGNFAIEDRLEHT